MSLACFTTNGGIGSVLSFLSSVVVNKNRRDEQHRLSVPVVSASSSSSPSLLTSSPLTKHYTTTSSSSSTSSSSRNGGKSHDGMLLGSSHNHTLNNNNNNTIMATSNSNSNNNNSSSKKSANDAIIALLLELGMLIASGLLASYVVGKLAKSLQGGGGPGGPVEEEMERAATAAESRLRKLLEDSGRPRDDIPPFTSYERQIAQDVIDPRDITVHFADIGGLDDQKQEIWELAVLPLQQPELFAASKLLQAPGGILLYGPPGTGKTMLAKAIAKEADATFLAVKLSKIMNKWFGESNKLIDAIFSLAKKLAPSIIFIDELDTFLNPRDGAENSAGNAIKAEFLTLWDGITTDGDGSGPVMVLGATNRPNHVDNAILRRLPRLFKIDLPDANGRFQILTLTLTQSNHPVHASATTFLPQLAQETIGYSGSDLKELLNCAALEAVREMMRERSKQAVLTRQHTPPRPEPRSSASSNKKKQKQNNKKKKPNKHRLTKNGEAEPTQQQEQHQPEGGKDAAAAAVPPVVRPMTADDLKAAMKKVKRTGAESADYDESQNGYSGGDNRRGSSAKTVNMNQLMQLMMASLSQQQQPPRPASSGGEGSSYTNNNHDDIPELL